MKRLGWLCSILLLLSLVGCTGSSSGPALSVEKAAIWNQYTALMAPDMAWDLDDIVDLDELQSYLEAVFPYFTDRFTITDRDARDIREIDPASFGESQYRTREFTQAQILTALDEGREQGWDAVDRIDDLDRALLGRMLQFLTSDETYWLDYLAIMTEGSDYTSHPESPWVEEPVLQVTGSKAELILQWLAVGLLDYEGDQILVENTLLFSLYWTKDQGSWRVHELEFTARTALYVPKGYWTP